MFIILNCGGYLALVGAWYFRIITMDVIVRDSRAIYELINVVKILYKKTHS